MATQMILPRSFTVSSAVEAPAYPASNLNIDRPSLMWRTNKTTALFVVVDLGNTQPWDTVAFTKSNLRSTDQITVRAANTLADVNAGTNLTVNQTVNAWSGTAPTDGATTVLTLATPVTSPFLRIVVTAGSHPDGYVQASRLVIGKRVEEEGIDWFAEQSHEDTSEQNIYRGAVYVDPYDTKMAWKFTMTGVTEASYMNNWYPLLRNAGNKKGVLFIPDHVSPYLQNEAVFGLITASAKGQAISSGEYKLDLGVREL